MILILLLLPQPATSTITITIASAGGGSVYSQGGPTNVAFAGRGKLQRLLRRNCLKAVELYYHCHLDYAKHKSKTHSAVS